MQGRRKGGALEAGQMLAEPTELFATCFWFLQFASLQCSPTAASDCGAGPPLHRLAGWCPHWFPCVSLLRTAHEQPRANPLVGNYFQLFSDLVEFQARALVCFSCGLEKCAVWNNIVESRTLNLCMEQEGKLFFHFSTGGCGNKREIETETYFLLH